MRIVASVALVAFSVATAPVLADELEWGSSLYPTTIWDAHCKDGSEYVVSGRCTITDGSGTLQNVGINDESDTWTFVWGQTVKATARALCAK